MTHRSSGLWLERAGGAAGGRRKSNKTKKGKKGVKERGIKKEERWLRNREKAMPPLTCKNIDIIVVSIKKVREKEE